MSNQGPPNKYGKDYKNNHSHRDFAPSVKPKSPPTNQFSIPTKFEKSANMNLVTWVTFILRFRKQAVSHFAEAAETVRLERKILFRLPVPPESSGSGINPEFEVYKQTLSQVMSKASKYAEATSKAVDLILSEKFMTTDLRIQVESHPLFHHVLRDSEPDEDECNTYLITPTRSVWTWETPSFEDEVQDYVTNVPPPPPSLPVPDNESVKAVVSQVIKQSTVNTSAKTRPTSTGSSGKLTKEDLSTSPRGENPPQLADLNKLSEPQILDIIRRHPSMHTALVTIISDSMELLQEQANTFSREKSTPEAVQGFIGKNVVLLLQIIRNIVLNLSPVTFQQMEVLFNGCWQLNRPFHEFLEEYVERLKLLRSVGISKSDEVLTQHFMTRLSREQLRVPCEALQAMQKTPTCIECIRFIKKAVERDEARKSEYNTTMTMISAMGGITGISPQSDQRVAMQSISIEKPKGMTRACKHCGEWHFDKECPHPKQSGCTSSSNATDGTKWCHYCDSPTHNTADCNSLKRIKEKKVSKPPLDLKEKALKKLKNAMKTIKETHAETELGNVLKTALGPETTKKANMTRTNNQYSNSSVVYLDNCAQVSVVIDKDMLSNFQTCETDITLQGITGPGSREIRSKGCGYLYGLYTYWVPEATSNLISQSQMTDAGYRLVWDDDSQKSAVIYNSDDELIFNASYVDSMFTISVADNSLTTMYTPSPPCKGARCSTTSCACKGDILATATMNILKEAFGESSVAYQALLKNNTATQSNVDNNQQSTMDILRIALGEDSPAFQQLLMDQYQPKSSIPIQSNFQTKKDFRSEEILTIYNQLGRPPIDFFKRCINNGWLLNCPITAKDVDTYSHLLDTDGARAIATNHRSDNQHSVTPVVNSIGELVHADIIFDDFGKPYLLAEDRESKMRCLVSLTSKSTDRLNDAFQKIITGYRKHGHSIQQIVSDSEKVLIATQHQLSKESILLTHTPPGMHDPIIERSWRTVKELVIILKTSMSYMLPPELEHTVLEYAVYLLNRRPNTTTFPLTPWEIFTGNKLDLKTNPLLPFGQIAVFHVGESLRTPMHPNRNELGIYVGKNDHTPMGYKVFVPSRGTIVTRYGKWTPLDKPPEEWKLLPNPVRATKQQIQEIANQINSEQPSDVMLIGIGNEIDNDLGADEVCDTVIDESSENHTTNIDQLEFTESILNPSPMEYNDIINHQSLNTINFIPTTVSETLVDSHADQSEEPFHHPYGLRDRSKLRRKIYLNAISRRSEHKCNLFIELNTISSEIKQNFLTSVLNGHDPHTSNETRSINKTYAKSALANDNPHKDSAYQAILLELEQMKSMEVFETIKYTDIPPQFKSNIISSIIFIKNKYRADGTFEKTKARLAARGDQQHSTVFSDDNSSPTAQLTSLFTILSIATKYQCYVQSVDVPGAYLHAKLKKDDHIYMYLPRECESIWCELNDQPIKEYQHDNHKIYVKLNKALYGLRQSSVLWYNTLAGKLQDIGFKPLQSDQCIFIKRISPEKFIISLIYVDDILLVSTDTDLIDYVINLLTKSFGKLSRQCGNILSFLSLMIEINPSRTSLSINQSVYVSKIVAEFESENGVVGTFYTPSTNNLFNDNSESESLGNKQKNQYLSIIMSLMYAAIRTRPDVLKEVTFLATRVKDPKICDWNKLTRVIGYLKRFNNNALIMTNNNSDMNIVGYADASFNIHHDSAGHSGILITVYGNPVVFKSNKQKLIVKSSCEAELVALDECITYIVFLQNFLAEIEVTFNVPITVYQDNMATMAIANTGKGQFKRTKHIANRYFWVHQFIISGDIVLQYLPTAQMIADILTKPILGDKFHELIKPFFEEKLDVS